jgi:hypothetical protein
VYQEPTATPASFKQHVVPGGPTHPGSGGRSTGPELSPAWTRHRHARRGRTATRPLLHAFLLLVSALLALSLFGASAALADTLVTGTATASSSAARYPAKYMNDGSTRTYWLGSSSAAQTVTMDLGSAKALTASAVEWKAARTAIGFVLSASADGATWTQLADQSANTLKSTNTQLAGSYRYLRMSVLSGSNGIYEWRVYAAAEAATPTATATPSPTPTTSATPTPTPTATPTDLNVKDYGAKGDGVSDDRAAITAAAKDAVAAGQRVYFPAGSYRLAGTLSAVAGAYYYGPSGVTLQTVSDVFAASGCTFDGFTFASYGSATAIKIGQTPAYTPTLVTGVTVKNCSFVAGSTQYTRSRIIVFLGHDCVIDHNTFTGTAASGGNIQVIGGKRNRITNNTITGGTTAILFMWSRTGNGGQPDSVIEDNVVTGNVYSGYSEEGISFDLKASAPDCGAFEYDAVKTVSGQQITLSSLPFPSYLGFDIVFVDGKLAGRTRTITAQSGNVFTVSGSLSGAAAGDHVEIAAPYKHNYVAGNTGTSLQAGGYSAILLYGLCFGNTVENNTVVQGKIKVQSLDNTAVATGSATGAPGRAPCGFNTVTNNTVQDSAGRIYLEYYALGTSYATAFTSTGNNVTGNTTPVVEGLHQNAYISGNSGTTKYTGVTLATSPFSYDGQ